MHAIEDRSRPDHRPGAEITHFVVLPPASPAFQGDDWRPDFRAFLQVEFPGLTIDLIEPVEDGLRPHPVEPLVMPIAGTIGAGWSKESSVKPVTIRTRQLVREISIAISSYRPCGHSRMN